MREWLGVLVGAGSYRAVQCNPWNISRSHGSGARGRQATNPFSTSSVCPAFATFICCCLICCSRVDDQVGPLAMALVFVASMSAVMLVNIADLVLLMRARDEDQGGGDEGGETNVQLLELPGVQAAMQLLR